MEQRPRAHPLLRTIRLVAGGALLTAGLVGLVVPVMPGWLLIIPGLSLWSTEFVWAARLRNRAHDELSRRRQDLKDRRGRSTEAA